MCIVSSSKPRSLKPHQRQDSADLEQTVAVVAGVGQRQNQNQYVQFSGCGAVQMQQCVVNVAG